MTMYGTDPGLALGFAGVVHRDDGRVVQRRRVLRLPAEPGLEGRVVGEVRAQHLDGNVPAEPQVAAAMHLGHAADADAGHRPDTGPRPDNPFPSRDPQLIRYREPSHVVAVGSGPGRDDGTGGGEHDGPHRCDKVDVETWPHHYDRRWSSDHRQCWSK